MLGAALIGPQGETGEAEARMPRKTRTRAVLAAVVDLGTLAVALGAGLALATVWLLARTDAGAVDPRSGDALLGWALWLAAAPTWSVWQWQALRLGGATRGARVAGLEPTAGYPSPQPSPTRGEGVTIGEGRLGMVALMLHPVALPLLGWGAVCLILVPVGVVSLVGFALGLVTAVLATVALISAGWCLVRPEAVPLHARLARGAQRLGSRRA